MNSRRKKNRLIIITALAALILLLVVIIYGFPKAYDTMKDTYVTEYKSIEEADEVTGYLVRNEKVYAASIAGKIKYKTDEGTKVRRGIRIAKVNKGEAKESEYPDLIQNLGDALVVQDKLLSERIGVVSYYVDGYEGKLSTSNIKNMTYEGTIKLQNNYIDLKRNSVAAGDPIYKIYKNNKWCIVYWVTPKEAERYEKGNRVTVYFEDADVRATISRIDPQGDKVRITLRSNLYYKSLANTRVADIRVVLRGYNGLSIETGSITEQKGIKGVMVKQPSGENVFTPINIIYQSGDTTIVSPVTFTDENGDEQNTVRAYDEILRRP